MRDVNSAASPRKEENVHKDNATEETKPIAVSGNRQSNKSGSDCSGDNGEESSEGEYEEVIEEMEESLVTSSITSASHEGSNVSEQSETTKRAKLKQMLHSQILR